MRIIPAVPVQIAAIACQDFDPTNGDFHLETGITTYTPWGEIAYRIGGIQDYNLLRGSDEKKISPGTGVLQQLIQDRPTLIVLNEIAQYSRKAKVTIVGNSDLLKQVVAFLFALMDLAGSCNNYSLASSSDTFADETAELQETIRASARQEKIFSSSTDVELYNIVKQRLFQRVDEKAVKQAAQEYFNAYRSSRVNLPDGCKDASYIQAIGSSYPIHPELFNLLTKKIASIPNFNRTRGALRLFAVAVRYLWRDRTNWMPMIHAHHLPIGVDEEITNELTSRLERPLMRLPIQADIYNANGREAHAQGQNQDWLAAGKPPFSTWIGRTIFLHSINQGVVAGIRRAELNLSLLTPGIEIGFMETALDRLSAVAWYLDVDPVTSIARFKEEPSINKIIAEEKAQAGRSEAKDDLQSRRDTIFENRYFTLISSPESSSDVDDSADSIALCVVHFNEATVQSSMGAETAKLRSTIVQGLTTGQWDLKVGERVYIKTDAAPLIPPDSIEFSERMVLYRRNILEPPKPREIEINAQVMPSTQPMKPVRVRWKATGALTIRLFQDGNLIGGNYLPSDEYEGEISQTTTFRVVADYGEGETAAAESKAKVQTYPMSSGVSPTAHDTSDLFIVKPDLFDLVGSLNGVFNELLDLIHDDKISAIERLELSVSEVIDYRKFMTTLPLLMRYPIRVDQFVTIQGRDQFVRLEYQGNIKGFQSYANPTNTLLSTLEVRAEVSLKITIEFASPVQPEGTEMKAIEQALGRNPVDRLNLTVKVIY